MPARALVLGWYEDEEAEDESGDISARGGLRRFLAVDADEVWHYAMSGIVDWFDLEC